MATADGSMTGVMIEHATADDDAAIRELVREGRVNPTSLDWHNFVVARHPNKGLVGCAQIRNAPWGAGREIKSVVVRQGFRDGAVSRAMLRRLIADEHEVIWGTCARSLAPYYVRFGCEIVRPLQVPLYYRVMGAAAAVIHRIVRGKRAPAMVVLRFRPPAAPGA